MLVRDGQDDRIRRIDRLAVRAWGIVLTPGLSLEGSGGGKRACGA